MRVPSLIPFLAGSLARSKEKERKGKNKQARRQAIIPSTLKVWCEQMNQADLGKGRVPGFMAKALLT